MANLKLRLNVILALGLALSTLAWGSSDLEIAKSFKNQKKSLVNWKELDTSEWLSFSDWKKETTLKDEHPDWEVHLRERNHRALMGRVLDCIGECRIYKGEGFVRAGFRSTLYQGDEVTTLKDSYLWIYMLDGTLVRLSPDSSMTLRELNIGEKENFLHARLNAGNILWLSRSEKKHLEDNIRETDSLFLPLVFHEANPPFKEVSAPDESNLYQVIEQTDQDAIEQKVRLNKLIEQNNALTQGRKTYSFLVMPNGSVFGEGVQAEFIVLLGGESFVKQRLYEEISLESEQDPPALTFFYRGFENKSEFQIGPGIWYRVNSRGRLISQYNAPSLFGVGEYITKRIPTILIARELLLKRYSKFIFEDMSALRLAKEHGHRKWGELDKEADDLAQRFSFVKEHTRRVETSLLLTSSRFKEKVLEEKGEVISSMEYSPRFYSRAMAQYKRQRELDNLYKTGQDQLNSTKRKFWKIIHARRSFRNQ